MHAATDKPAICSIVHHVFSHDGWGLSRGLVTLQPQCAAAPSGLALLLAVVARAAVAASCSAGQFLRIKTTAGCMSFVLLQQRLFWLSRLWIQSAQAGHWHQKSAQAVLRTIGSCLCSGPGPHIVFPPWLVPLQRGGPSRPMVLDINQTQGT